MISLKRYSHRSATPLTSGVLRWQRNHNDLHGWMIQEGNVKRFFCLLCFISSSSILFNIICVNRTFKSLHECIFRIHLRGHMCRVIALLRVYACHIWSHMNFILKLKAYTYFKYTFMRTGGNKIKHTYASWIYEIVFSR